MPEQERDEDWYEALAEAAAEAVASDLETRADLEWARELRRRKEAEHDSHN